MTDPLHGKRDEKAFRGEQLGGAKTRAEQIGETQRGAFSDMMRMLEAWAGDGIKIDPACVTFDNEVDQAAWTQFTKPSSLRGALEPPMMDDERAILHAVTG